MVVVDTSVIIDHLQRSAEESILIKLLDNKSKQTFGVSVISIQELFEGKSTRDEVKEIHLLSTLGFFEILPYSTEEAKMAGKIARDLKDPIEFTDAAIAATTIANKGELATLNRKHFNGVPGLDLIDF